MSTSISRRSRHLVAIALAAVALSPAQAWADDAAENASQNQRAEAPRAADAERKYCVQSDFTATRVQRRICKTKKEWADQGIDITRPAN